MKTEIATFGNGCFWCTEAIFQMLEGVISVQSGYMGGDIENPSYEAVCTGETGHAEVLQIVFDPIKINYSELLEVFWKTHDPTSLNKQGNDIGTQYRSVIFYHNPEQQLVAVEYKTQLDQSGTYANPIVTLVEPAATFYAAEDYHKNYVERHPENTYCQFVVRPKIEKFKKSFESKLKKS